MSNQSTYCAGPWSGQRVVILRQMWSAGYSASEISRRLGGGITRNAVIGKAHRLKLSKRPSPIIFDKPSQPDAKTKKLDDQKVDSVNKALLSVKGSKRR